MVNNGPQRPLWHIPVIPKLIPPPVMNILINKKAVINTTIYKI